MFVLKSKLSHVPWCLRAWLIASRLIRKPNLFPVPSALHFLLSYLLTLAGPQGPNPHNLEAISKLSSQGYSLENLSDGYLDPRWFQFFSHFLFWNPVWAGLRFPSHHCYSPSVVLSLVPNTLQSVVNKWSLLSPSCCFHWTGSFIFQEVPLLFSWQQKLSFVSYYYYLSFFVIV